MEDEFALLKTRIRSAGVQDLIAVVADHVVARPDVLDLVAVPDVVLIQRASLDQGHVLVVLKEIETELASPNLGPDPDQILVRSQLIVLGQTLERSLPSVLILDLVPVLQINDQSHVMHPKKGQGLDHVL